MSCWRQGWRAHPGHHADGLNDLSRRLARDDPDLVSRVTTSSQAQSKILASTGRRWRPAEDGSRRSPVQ